MSNIMRGDYRILEYPDGSRRQVIGNNVQEYIQPVEGFRFPLKDGR